MVRLTNRPDMTLDVYRGNKTTKQQQFSHMPFEDGIFSLFLHIGKYFVHIIFSVCHIGEIFFHTEYGPPFLVP